ncbi:MAG: acyl-CoA dehydrogenase family protein [Rhizobiales bacterium]|nr:acyl-CoA dehydrogenase family protein [Hyphomicrobiales bacterium]
MDFELTEEQTLIKQSACKFAEDLLAPNAPILDKGEGQEDFLANLKTLAQAGFMGINISSKYGGTEAGVVSYALALEETARACASTAVTLSVTNLVAEIIETCGTEAQRAAHIPKICDGTYSSGAFCLTEAGAGSDPSGMQTRAKMDGNEWVLNGEKIFVTSGGITGIFVVWAVTDPDAPKGKGISCFLVEPDTKGLIIGRAEKKMGQRGSLTNVITFDDCRIPADAMLGAENDGFRIAVGELAGGRIGIASVARGIARAALDAGKSYIGERRQFGKRIADFQGIQWQLVDHETELEAARLLILQAALLKEQGKPFGPAASMAKLFSTEAAQRACYTALQLHGGAGYTEEFAVERYMRDVRVTTIYEGTSEVQRVIIARDILAQMERTA